MKDKYIIIITILSILLSISILIIIIGTRIIEDLNITIETHKNTIGVCNVDLRQVQNENEELRTQMIEECRKKD